MADLQASQKLVVSDQCCASLAAQAEGQAASSKHRIHDLEAQLESVKADLRQAQQAHTEASSATLGERKALADEVEVLQKQLHNRGMHLEAQAGKVLLLKQVSCWCSNECAMHAFIHDCLKRTFDSSPFGMH
jgi:phosphoenolpyruvate carboxylase